MTTVRQLFTQADLDQLLVDSARGPLLVFKHSTACPLSARAHRAWTEFLALPEAESVTNALVRVIEERPVSLALAERVGVEHESPQALLIQNGQALWHDSHRSITAEALTDAVRRLAVQ